MRTVRRLVEVVRLLAARAPDLAVRLVVVGGGVLAASLVVPRTHAWDERVVRRARRLATARSDRLLRALTRFGRGDALAVGTALAACWLARRDKTKDAASVVAASLGAGAANEIVRRLVARERPRFVDVVPPKSASFPSGHALGSAAFATSLALALGGAAVVPLAVYTAAMGASRVLLGVHYPSDVATGWVGGFAWALASRVR